MWQLKFCDGRIPIPCVLPVTSPCLHEGKTNGAALKHPQEKRKKIFSYSRGKSAWPAVCSNKSPSRRWVNSKVCSSSFWTARNIFQCWDMLVKLVGLLLLRLAQVRSLFKAGHGRGKGINSAEAKTLLCRAYTETLVTLGSLQQMENHRHFRGRFRSLVLYICSEGAERNTEFRGALLLKLHV